MVASLLMIQTDSAVFDFPSTTFEYNDGALVNKWWRITWKSVKLNVLILVVETIGPYLLSIFVNRICTLMWMLSLIMKVIRCLYLFQPRERGRLRFHMLQNVQIALDFLRYRKVSHTTLLLTCDIGRWARLYIALDFLRYRKVSQTTLLLTCDTGRWVRLHCSWLAIQEGEPDYIALDLRYRTVSQTLHCSWLLVMQEGESHYIALDFLRYRTVSQTTLLLTCDTGRWVRLYIALDFLYYRQVSPTVDWSWLLVIQADESHSTFLKK